MEFSYQPDKEYSARFPMFVRFRPDLMANPLAELLNCPKGARG